VVPENDDMGMSESFLNITTSWEKKEKNMKIFLLFLMFVRKKEHSHQRKRHGTAGNRFSSVSCGYSCKKGGLLRHERRFHAVIRMDAK